MKLNFFDSYKGLQKVCRSGDYKSITNIHLLEKTFKDSLDYLINQNKENLLSTITGKTYFAFKKKNKLSRPINTRLYIPETQEIKNMFEVLKSSTPKNVKDYFNTLEPDKITSLVYTIAISFCCATDLVKDGDQKTPGTFFEYFIGSIFAKLLNINPSHRIKVLSLDEDDVTLPTDFIFDLGKNKPKYHVPVKISTRERSIQVWAHQRILNGVHGTGRFLGIPVIMTETKLSKDKKEVTEICTPSQWQIYQMHIAQLKRIYYLDIPEVYNNLNTVFPPIPVNQFGYFFFEVDSFEN